MLFNRRNEISNSFRGTAIKKKKEKYFLTNFARRNRHVFTISYCMFVPIGSMYDFVNLLNRVDFKPVPKISIIPYEN